MGGRAVQANGTAHRFRADDPTEASEAGRLGGRLKGGIYQKKAGYVHWPAEEYDRLIQLKREDLKKAIAEVAHLERTIVNFERAKASIYGKQSA